MASDRWLEPKWQDSAEANGFLNLLLRRNKRRQFGLLEEPGHGQTGSPVIRYKILLWGKAGIGKTSTVAKLCGLKVPPLHYETPGIRVTSTFWPAKLMKQGKVIFFRFEFWDVGDRACSKFDHILPACKDKVDAVMFLFSFTDRSSFEDLPNQMSQLLAKDSNVLKLVVGTRFDLFSRSDVTETELRSFAQQFDVPVLRIRNVNNTRQGPNGTPIVDGRASLLEIAPLMNTVGEFLLQRDHRVANPRAGMTMAMSPSVSLPLANMATALPRAPHQQAPHIDKAAYSSSSTITAGMKRSSSPANALATVAATANAAAIAASPAAAASSSTAAGGRSAADNPIGPGRRIPSSVNFARQPNNPTGHIHSEHHAAVTGERHPPPPSKPKGLHDSHHHSIHGYANIVSSHPHARSYNTTDASRPARGIMPSVSEYSLASHRSSSPSPRSSGDASTLMPEPPSRSSSLPRQGVSRPGGSRPATNV